MVERAPVLVLQSELAVAFDSKSDDDSIKYERERYIRSLKAISTFLNQIGASRSYGKRFYRLALALDDLNSGTVDPLLQEVPTGGTKKLNGSWVWCARAHVCVGILALEKAGLTGVTAAKKAADEFPELRKLAGLNRQNPSATETKILNWLSDFKKENSKIKNRQAKAMFASGSQEISRLPNDVEALHKVANRMFTSALE